MKKNKTLLILLPVFLIFLNISCGGESEEERQKRLRGTSIIETGELAAIDSRSFPLARYGRQFWEMKIIGLQEHGAIVKAGDSIIQLDPADVKKMIIDWETNLETELANLQTLRVNQDNRRNTLDASLKGEIASFELKKIELEATRFEAERIKKIKELEFKQAEIRLAKEKRKMELNDIIEANDLKIQEIRVAQIETQIKNAYDILPRLTIRTPISGVFQIEKKRRSRDLLKVGDEVYPGDNMGRVPDLEWMKVETHVSETDFMKINLGQKVAVRLDAMPDVTFDGEITYIGRLCKPKDSQSRQKGFDVEVKMLTSDERLKPGMTVSCEFLEN